MSTQTIKTSFNPANELAVPNITVVTAATNTAANAEPVITTGARNVLASLSALVILVVSAWAASSDGAAGILQASVWAAALVFFALAIENNEEEFGELVTIGVALAVLGMISITIASEIAVVAAAIVAAWVHAKVIRI